MNTTEKQEITVEELTAALACRTAELESARAMLKRETEERLKTERQLRHAQDMEALNQLAAGVGHDFNNILTVIHGHASMLLMRLGEQGPHAKSVKEIRESAERAAGLVRQLLQFSRKQVLQFRNVDLGDVLRSVSGTLRKMVGERIIVVTECAEPSPQAYADRAMVEQLIVNLTLSARDAMPQGGTVAVRATAVNVAEQKAAAHPEARAGDFACLAITDTGSGMDAQALSHLFEPFHPDASQGTGLGMAAAYGMVKRHKGWIEADSELNVGTTLRIYLPLAPAQGTGIK